MTPTILLALPLVLPQPSCEQPGSPELATVVEETVHRTHEVMDLVAPGFVELNRIGAASYASQEDVERWQASMDSLVESIRAYSPHDGLEVSYESLPMLEVKGSEEAQSWVESFLATQREAALSMYDARVRIVEFEGELPVDLLPEPGPSHVLPDEDARGAFLTRMEDARADVLTSPRVVVLPRQRASITVQEQVAYVKNYVLRIFEPGAQVLADPEVDTISEGIELELGVTPLGGGRLGLDLEATLSHVERPIATRSVTLAPDIPEVQISSPVCRELRLGGLLQLEPGSSSVLVASRPTGDGYVLLLLEVEEVPGEGAHSGAPGPEGGDGR